MVDERQDPYALWRLVLEYLRVFLWPLVVLSVVLIYEDDVRKIVSEREVDIFGLRIGQQVADIEERTKGEIADIRHLLETQQARATPEGGEIVEDIQAKLASLESNLDREIGRIQQIPEPAPGAAPKPPPEAPAGSSEPDRARRAAAAERRGFEAVVARDLDAALAAFEEAYRIWPDYHNVQEIRERLERDREHLQDPADDRAWTQLYRAILTRYSWGLPDELRPRFRTETAAAY